MSEMITIEGDLEAVNEHFLARGWSDGLPVVPPTPERVEQMLAATPRDRHEVLAKVAPLWNEATVLNVAVNAVMAGCRPEYLPVVIAAVQAATEPAFNLHALQATTNPVTTLVVVSGPAVARLGFNARGNCLGPGSRANATAGRAVRLALANVGGAIPIEIDKASLGQPGKYGMCLAANDADSPWTAWNVEMGFGPDVSTVTLFAVTGTHNVLENHSRTAVGVLRTIASSMATLGHQNIQLGGGPVVLLVPEHARIIADGGYSRAEMQWFLYENARVRMADFPPEQLEGTVRLRRPGRFQSDNPQATVPGADAPEEIAIIVAGGPGPHSQILPTFGPQSLTRPITKVIDGGRP